MKSNAIKNLENLTGQGQGQLKKKITIQKKNWQRQEQKIKRNINANI